MSSMLDDGIIYLDDDDEEEFDRGEEQFDDGEVLVDDDEEEYDDGEGIYLSGGGDALQDGREGGGVDYDDGMHTYAESMAIARESGSAKEEEAAAQQVLSPIASDRWCQHFESSVRWLRAFLCAIKADGGQHQQSPSDNDDDPSTAFWYEMKEQTYTCLHCVDRYMDAKREVLSFLETSAITDGDVAHANFAAQRLDYLDRQFLSKQLNEAKQGLSDARDLPSSFVFALFDLLVNFRILEDGPINASFEVIMNQISSMIDMDASIANRKLPGLYYLLTHTNKCIRSWAVKMVKQVGTIGLNVFRETVEPIFRQWFEVLEDDYFQSLDRGGGGGGSSSSRLVSSSYNGPTECWTALRLTLELLEDSTATEELACHISSQFPMLADILMSHVEPSIDTGGATYRTTSECLRLFMTKLGDQAWSSETFTPSFIFDSICRQLQRGSSLHDAQFKAVLDLLPPFLKSIRHYRPNPSERRSQSYVDTALQTLVRIVNTLPSSSASSAASASMRTSPSKAPSLSLARRRFLDAIICQIIHDAYDPTTSSPSTWPVKSSTEWAPLLVLCLEPTGELSSSKREETVAKTILRVMEAHEGNVKEKIMDAARGIVNVDDEEEDDGQSLPIGERSDFFCARLMHQLTRVLPVLRLPASIRDCLFRNQSILYLAPRNAQLQPSPPLKNLSRACSDQTAAFTSYLNRISSGPSTTANPFRQALDDDARAQDPFVSSLASTVIPILLTEDEGTRTALLKVVGGGSSNSSSMSVTWRAVLTRISSDSLIRSLWRGVSQALKNLMDLGPLETVSSWWRLFLMMLELIECTTGSSQVASAASPVLALWWPFTRKMLSKPSSRWIASMREENVIQSFFRLCVIFLPSFSNPALRDHTSWLGSFVDWAMDGSVVDRAFDVHKVAIEAVIQALETLRARGIALNFQIGTRLLTISGTGSGGRGTGQGNDEDDFSLGSRLRALINIRPLNIAELLPAGAERKDDDEEVEDFIAHRGKVGLTPSTPALSTPAGGRPPLTSSSLSPSPRKRLPYLVDHPVPDDDDMMERKEREEEEDDDDEAVIIERPVKAPRLSETSSKPAAVAPSASVTDGQEKRKFSDAAAHLRRVRLSLEPPPSSRQVKSITSSTAAVSVGGAVRRPGGITVAPPAAPSSSSLGILSAPIQKVVDRPTVSKTKVEGPVHDESDFEIFRHLKELTARSHLIAREFHRHVVSWSLKQLLPSVDDRRGGGKQQHQQREKRWDDVPIRFRDAQHYLDVFEPLLIEECRCALGKDFQESLSNSTGVSSTSMVRADGSKQRGQRGSNPGDAIALQLQNAVIDAERDGLCTVHFTIDYRRSNGDRIRTSGSGNQDVFLLQSRGKKPAALLEDGELSDEESVPFAQASSNRREIAGSNGGYVERDPYQAAQLPHCIAVLVESQETGGRGGGAGNSSAAATGGDGEDSMRFRVMIHTPSSMSPGGVKVTDFKPQSLWVATVIGSVTTNIREFSALREMQRVRLAPRLVHGGKEKPSQGLEGLTYIDLEGMKKVMQELRGLTTKCEQMATTSEADLKVLRIRIKALSRLRISQRLLNETNAGRDLKHWKKTHHNQAVRELCGKVIENWKKQVKQENECYQGVSQTVVASTQGGSQGGGSQDAKAPYSTSSNGKKTSPRQAKVDDEAPVLCPVHVPLDLWKKLRQQFNRPQLRAIAQSTHIHSSSFAKKCEVTLLQGPPGTGKTRTIMGLLSAILHASQRWALLNRAGGATAEGRTPLSASSSNIRPSLRVGGQRANRILVCAPSNGAVDEIVLRLLQGGLIDAKGKVFYPSIVRLGAVDAEAAPEVQRASLDFQVQNRMKTSFQLRKFEEADAHVIQLRTFLTDVNREVADFQKADSVNRKGNDITVQHDATERLRIAEHRRQQVRMELSRATKTRWDALKALEAERSNCRNAIIRDAKVVLSTLSTSVGAHLNDAVAATSRGFATVVVDEAGQAVEPSTIIPLRYGCRNLILVGDPRQLPATVISPDMSKHRYDMSLFERLEKGGHPVHMLTVQYRMHPAIRSFPSKLFYDDKLQDAPHLTTMTTSPAAAAEGEREGPEKEREQVIPYHNVPYFAPYLVYDVDGRENRHGTSIANEAEAHFALQLFRRFQVEFPSLVGAENMAIITPYRSQVRTLHRIFEQALGRNYGRLIQLSTVDGFQGREKEIIIFSCVRADPRGSIGFLADRRRMNVGLTRARRSLFVLGHVPALATDSSWKALVDDAHERRCLIEGRRQKFDEVALRMVQGKEGCDGVIMQLPQEPRKLACSTPASLYANNRGTPFPPPPPPPPLPSLCHRGSSLLSLFPPPPPPVPPRSPTTSPKRSRPTCATNKSSSSKGGDDLLAGLLSRCAAPKSPPRPAAPDPHRTIKEASSSTQAGRTTGSSSSTSNNAASGGEGSMWLSSEDRKVIEAHGRITAPSSSTTAAVVRDGGWISRRPLVKRPRVLEQQSSSSSHHHQHGGGGGGQEVARFSSASPRNGGGSGGMKVPSASPRSFQQQRHPHQRPSSSSCSSTSHHHQQHKKVAVVVGSTNYLKAPPPQVPPSLSRAGSSNSSNSSFTVGGGGAKKRPPVPALSSSMSSSSSSYRKTAGSRVDVFSGKPIGGPGGGGGASRNLDVTSSKKHTISKEEKASLVPLGLSKKPSIVSSSSTSSSDKKQQQPSSASSSASVAQGGGGGGGGGRSSSFSSSSSATVARGGSAPTSSSSFTIPGQDSYTSGSSGLNNTYRTSPAASACTTAGSSSAATSSGASSTFTIARKGGGTDCSDKGDRSKKLPADKGKGAAAAADGKKKAVNKRLSVSLTSLLGDLPAIPR